MIDRTLLRAVRADMDAAFVAIAKKHDLLIKCGAGRFTETTATLKIDISVADPTAKSPKEIVARSQWNKHWRLYGLKQEWLGKMFATQGEVYEILGLATTRRKYPVMTHEYQYRRHDVPHL